MIAIACVGLGLRLLGSVSDFEPWLTLRGQRVAAQVTGTDLSLEAKIVAYSRLPVGVTDMEVGILFASDPSSLERIKPGAVYRTPSSESRSKEVGATRHWIHFDAPLIANEHRPVSFRGRATMPGSTMPTIFSIHVLNYRLVNLPGPLVFELLQSPHGSDEAALTGMFGLLGGASERRQARGRWPPGAKKDLSRVFEDRLGSKVPLEPTRAQTMAAVFSALALAVVGDETSITVLRDRADQPSVNHFDEQLQVLRAGRWLGSELETPLAFAIPEPVASMHGLLGWCADRLEAQLAVGSEPTGSAPSHAENVGPSIDAPSSNQETSERPEFGLAWGIGFAIAAALAWVGWRRTRAKE